MSKRELSRPLRLFSLLTGMLRELEGCKVRVVYDGGVAEGTVLGCDAKWNILLRLNGQETVIIRGDLVISVISLS